MGKGNYLSNKLLDSVLGGTVYTAAGTLDFALYTSTPTGAGGGTEVSTSGTAYARQSQTNNATNWPAASSQTKHNATEIDWATATASWGTVTSAAIFEGGTSNLLYFGSLSSSRVVNTGDSVKFLVNGITVTEQ